MSTLSLLRLKQKLKPQLEQLNQVISESLKSNIADINTISQHITENPGKRLRPLLTLLCANLFHPNHPKAIELAAIIELIHTATLLHDDVVDDSTQRRGKITANAQWGNSISVLVGDFLYSRSFQLMARLNHPQVFATLADTTNIIAEGEVMQLVYSNDEKLDEATHFTIIDHKTSALFAAATELAGMITGANEAQQQHLQALGRHFGIAYQLTDDLLDYNGDSQKLGKNTGDDFHEGKVTLPIIHALQHASGAQQQHLRQHFNGEKAWDFHDCLSLLEELQSLNYAYDKQHYHFSQALDHLNALPQSDHHTTLTTLIELMATRSH